MPPPPDLTSAEYTTAYNEAKNFGGDGITTPTQRTPEQTFIGTFWAYDGTPSLVRRRDSIIRLPFTLPTKQNSDPIELARLLALVNVVHGRRCHECLGIEISLRFLETDNWDSRIRSTARGRTGAGDGNDATVGDPTFTPLGAPASNLIGPNFTPPFPAYPSGHAGFGGAIFETIRRF